MRFLAILLSWLSIFTICAAMSRFQKIKCGNCNAVALNNPMFNITVRYLIECAAKCLELPWCNAFIFGNNICTGVDVTDLKGPAAGATNYSFVHASVGFLPLPGPATKMLAQANTQARWMELPSQKSNTSTCQQPPAFPLNTTANFGMVVNGRIVICAATAAVSNICFSLNPVTNSWDSFPSLPVPAWGAWGGASVMTPMGLWVVAISKPASSYLLDQSSNTWKSGPSFGKTTNFQCLVKITTTKYLMAGGSNSTNETWMFDWTTGIWTQKQNLTIGRYCMACSLCTYANGSQAVLAVGGQNSAISTSITVFIVEAFSLTTETWTRLANLPGGATNGAFVYDGNSLILVVPPYQTFFIFNSTSLNFTMGGSMPTGISSGYVDYTSFPISDAQLKGCK